MYSYFTLFTAAVRIRTNTNRIHGSIDKYLYVKNYSKCHYDMSVCVRLNIFKAEWMFWLKMKFNSYFNNLFHFIRIYHSFTEKHFYISFTWGELIFQIVCVNWRNSVPSGWFQDLGEKWSILFAVTLIIRLLVEASLNGYESKWIGISLLSQFLNRMQFQMVVGQVKKFLSDYAPQYPSASFQITQLCETSFENLC